MNAHPLWIINKFIFVNVLRFWELGHTLETASKSRFKVLNRLNFKKVTEEGISTLKYKIISVEESMSYTNYTVRLDPDLMHQSKRL